MYFIKSVTNDPYFNIATEEYLLKNSDDDFFLLYINEPSIIVGKHQNTLAEINVPYVFENNLKVVRRLSGGGTVFHDHGNLNYGFICNGKEGSLVDFKKYSQPILDTLQSLDVNAYLRGKSDLVIDDLKFSGNAEHVYRNRILHHGTLLFDSKLDELNMAIKADWGKFNDKAVRSNRSQVTNIKDHLPNTLTIDHFADLVAVFALKNYNHFEPFFLSVDDINAIQKLVHEKYRSWEWNFAYSPTYRFNHSLDTSAGTLKVDLSVEKGMISQLSFICCNNTMDLLSDIREELLGTKHEYLCVKNKLTLFADKIPNFGCTINDFMNLLF